jgi:hypothetical protein
MRSYYFDNVPGDQRLPHDYVPSRLVSPEQLEKLGVKHWTVPVEGHEPKIDAIAAKEGYKNRDVINVSKEAMGDVSTKWHLRHHKYIRHLHIPYVTQIYEQKIKTFFEE